MMGGVDEGALDRDVEHRMPGKKKKKKFGSISCAVRLGPVLVFIDTVFL